MSEGGRTVSFGGGGGGGGGEGFDEGRKDPNTTISGPSTGPPAKHNLNGVSLAGR